MSTYTQTGVITISARPIGRAGQRAQKVRKKLIKKLCSFGRDPVGSLRNREPTGRSELRFLHCITFGLVGWRWGLGQGGAWVGDGLWEQGHLAYCAYTTPSCLSQPSRHTACVASRQRCVCAACVKQRPTQTECAASTGE